MVTWKIGGCACPETSCHCASARGKHESNESAQVITRLGSWHLVFWFAVLQTRSVHLADATIKDQTKNNKATKKTQNQSPTLNNLVRIKTKNFSATATLPSSSISQTSLPSSDVPMAWPSEVPMPMWPSRRAGQWEWVVHPFRKLSKNQSWRRDWLMQWMEENSYKLESKLAIYFFKGTTQQLTEQNKTFQITNNFAGTWIFSNHVLSFLDLEFFQNQWVTELCKLH